MKRGDKVSILHGAHRGKNGELKQGLKSNGMILWEVIIMPQIFVKNQYPDTIWTYEPNLSPTPETAAGGEGQNEHL